MFPALFFSEKWRAACMWIYWVAWRVGTLIITRICLSLDPSHQTTLFPIITIIIYVSVVLASGVVKVKNTNCCRC